MNNVARLSLKCRLYGLSPHEPCSGTTDDGTYGVCQCWCHQGDVQPPDGYVCPYCGQAYGHPTGQTATETEPTGVGVLVVMRCADGPPAVPADTVQCDLCDMDCWISKATGANSLALAKTLNDDRIICSACLHGMVSQRLREQGKRAPWDPPTADIPEPRQGEE